jgi:hypothetical protein
LPGGEICVEFCNEQPHALFFSFENGLESIDITPFVDCHCVSPGFVIQGSVFGPLLEQHLVLDRPAQKYLKQTGHSRTSTASSKLNSTDREFVDFGVPLDYIAAT